MQSHRPTWYQGDSKHQSKLSAGALLLCQTCCKLCTAQFSRVDYACTCLQVIATDLVDALVSAARSFPRILSVESFRPLLAPNPGERPPNGLEMAGLLMGFRPLQKARWVNA
jgi:hypothetical protein